MRRRKYLPRRTWLTRHKRMRPVNRKRRVELYARNFGDRAEIVRAMPCIAAGRGSECWGPVEAAHVRSRGAGGNRRDLVPLCSAHHRRQHQQGVETFSLRHHLDLAAEASRIAADLDERGVP